MNLQYVKASFDAWNAIKLANPSIEKLAEFAIFTWDVTRDPRVKVAASKDERAAFAASFSGAYVVDQLINKYAAERRISEEERQKLAYLNSVSAINDLQEITKLAAPEIFSKLLAFAKRNPKATGAAAGAVVGGGLGAWADDDNRLRGGIMGAVPGAVIGGLSGQALHDAHMKFDLARKAEEIANKSKFQQGQLQHQLAQDQIDYAQKEVERLGKKAPLSPEEILQHFTGIAHQELAGEGLNPLGEMHPKIPFSNPSMEVGELEGGQGMRSFIGAPMPKKAKHVTDYYSSGRPKQGSYSIGQPSGGQDLTGGSPAMPGGNPAPQPQAQQGGAQPQMGAPEALGDPQQAAMEQQQKEEEQMAKDYAANSAKVDNLRFLAEQVGLPSMAQAIDADRDNIVQHFASGNQHLPHSLQKFFPKSEHASEFIEKYKKRFAPLGK